jgi:hypothetical protein
MCFITSRTLILHVAKEIVIMTKRHDRRWNTTKNILTPKLSKESQYTNHFHI